MAIAVLIVGIIVFGIGIAGQLVIGRRYKKNHHPGDRKGAQVVLTIAGIIIGAWMVIAGAAALLHAHSHAQQSTSSSSS